MRMLKQKEEEEGRSVTSFKQSRKMCRKYELAKNEDLGCENKEVKPTSSFDSL